MSNTTLAGKEIKKNATIAGLVNSHEVLKSSSEEISSTKGFWANGFLETSGLHTLSYSEIPTGGFGTLRA